MAVQELDYRHTDTDRVAATTATRGRKGKDVVNIYRVRSKYRRRGTASKSRDVSLELLLLSR